MRNVFNAKLVFSVLRVRLNATGRCSFKWSAERERGVRGIGSPTCSRTFRWVHLGILRGYCGAKTLPTWRGWTPSYNCSAPDLRDPYAKNVFEWKSSRPAEDTRDEERITGPRASRETCKIEGEGNILLTNIIRLRIISGFQLHKTLIIYINCIKTYIQKNYMYLDVKNMLHSRSEMVKEKKKRMWMGLITSLRETRANSLL